MIAVLEAAGCCAAMFSLPIAALSVLWGRP